MRKNIIRKNIVIPMAGAGSRFANIGITTPKPLVKIAGQEALFHALSSLPIAAEDKIIFISLKKHQIKKKISSKVVQRFFKVSIEWIEIDEVTEGQLCTVLLAKKSIDNTDPLIIHNCDTAFRSNLNSFVQDSTVDGAVSCLQAEGDQWSFAKVDDQGVVVATAEKERISPWASVGSYYFSSGKDFVRLAERRVQSQVKNRGEYYIAPLYNDFIHEGKKIMLDPVDWFQSMGTPEDILKYWGVDIIEDYNKNLPDTLVVDLDGTICTIKQPGETYEDVQPIYAVIEKLKEYKKNGFRIVIQTARHMRTCQNNVGKVTAQIGPITFEWLKNHHVPYDEVCFGKPWGANVMYIDDKAIRPDEFVTSSFKELQALTKKSEIPYSLSAAGNHKGECYV
ncbi:MAG: sugar phosphate nucleotidyltransferase [Oligoflexales bacterium]